MNRLWYFKFNIDQILVYLGNEGTEFFNTSVGTSSVMIEYNICVPFIYHINKNKLGNTPSINTVLFFSTQKYVDQSIVLYLYNFWRWKIVEIQMYLLNTFG